MAQTDSRAFPSSGRRTGSLQLEQSLQQSLGEGPGLFSIESRIEDPFSFRAQDWANSEFERRGLIFKGIPWFSFFELISSDRLVLDLISRSSVCGFGGVL